LCFYHGKCRCYICLILCEKLKFCQDFVPITCHENIMQVSIILHIAYSSWFNTFNYKIWDIYCLQCCKVYYPCHLFQLFFKIRFSNFHYIFCRNNLTTHIKKNLNQEEQAFHLWSTIRVLSKCIKLIRFLSKSKHFELLRFVHIVHHNSLLCIATKKSRFIWFFHITKYYWFPLH